MGRKSTFTPEIGARICSLVAEGETIKNVSKIMEINRATIFEWVQKYPAFADAIARAKILGADALADQLLAVSDECPDVHRARLKSDNLKWYIRCLNPARYGERIDVNVTETVNVRDALTAARARLVRPIRDQLEAEDAQLIEYQGESEIWPSDTESVDPGEPADSDEEDSIFD